MKITFLNTPCDMKWLHKTHNVPKEMRSAMIFGNEDAPKSIEAWYRRNPDYRQKPDFIYLQEAELVEG